VALAARAGGAERRRQGLRDGHGEHAARVGVGRASLVVSVLVVDFVAPRFGRIGRHHRRIAPE